MKILKILLIAVLLSPLKSQAGHDQGGGGNALICFNATNKDTKKILRDIEKASGRIDREDLAKIETAKLLEIADVEAFRDPDGQGAEFLQHQGSDVSSYIQQVLKRFDTYIPEYSAAIRHGRQTYSALNIVRSPDAIIRVLDYDYPLTLEMQKSCTILTVAWRHMKSGVQTLEIDQPLLDRITELLPLNLPVFYLHEYVAQTLYENRDYSSDKARHLVKQMISLSSNSTLVSFYNSYASTNLRGDGTLSLYLPMLEAKFKAVIAKMLYRVAHEITELPAKETSEYQKRVDLAWPSATQEALNELTSFGALDPMELTEAKNFFNKFHVKVRALLSRGPCTYFSGDSASVCTGLVNGRSEYSLWYEEAKGMFFKGRSYQLDVPEFKDQLGVRFNLSEESVFFPKAIYESISSKRLNFDGSLIK